MRPTIPPSIKTLWQNRRRLTTRAIILIGILLSAIILLSFILQALSAIITGSSP